MAKVAIPSVVKRYQIRVVWHNIVDAQSHFCFTATPDTNSKKRNENENLTSMISKTLRSLPQRSAYIYVKGNLLSTWS